MDVPSRLDFFALGRDYVVQRSTKVDPAQVDTEGSDANLFVGIGSVLAQQVARQLLYRTNALLLDGSNDEDLDRYAFDRYNLPRKGASPARTSVTISRANAAAGSGEVPIGTLLSTGTTVQYVTVTSASFSASALSVANVFVRAVQAGKATQAAKNEINRFAQPQLLWDPTLQVINPTAAAGGEEQESDDLFRARIRDFWRTQRRGVIGAIEFGALTVPGVVSARAIEALNSDGNPARVVNLYISDSSGVASDALADQVRIALNDYRAAGIAVIVFTSAPFIVDIRLRLRFLAGTSTRTVSDLVQAAVVEFVNSLPVNGTLFVGQLYSVLQRFEVDGLIPDKASIVDPVGDLVPAVGQTLRTTLANVVIE